VVVPARSFYPSLIFWYRERLANTNMMNLLMEILFTNIYNYNYLQSTQTKVVKT
jgi:hypothetical protein